MSTKQYLGGFTQLADGVVALGKVLTIKPDDTMVWATPSAYSLATASATILGGIKVGTGLSIDGSGVLSTTYSYSLPIASNSVLGGIKVGSGLSIDGSGVLSSTSSITGSGTDNYLARWTPSGTALGIGLIQDNNTSLGIGTVPSGNAANGFVSIRNTTNRPASLFVNNAPHANNNISFYTNLDASLASSATGIYNSVAGSSQTNIGISNILTGAGTKNTGVSVEVSGGTLNYSLKLVDGSQGIGKVLTCMTINGEANWATPAYNNLQKVITTTYILTDADNDYTIFVNNNSTAISISLGTITIPNFSEGFIQEGTADVTFVGVTNPVGLKLKGQGYQAFIERKLSTATYYLLGNTKV